MPPKATNAKASKPGLGCWTCKKRKIGCDRARPWCANCTGSGRECLGYDIRLLWPDQYDGRRREGVVLGYVPSAARSELSPYYGQQFLNVTFEDIASVDTDSSSSKSKTLVARPIQRVNRNPSPYPRLRDEDVLLLNYYQEKVSTMISTIQSQNGFRSELIPMTLSSSDSSASALRNAMMAVSAFHHYGTQAALPYKVTAVRCLSSSLASDSAYGAAETQAAASLMLCVYSVFDESDGNWHTHLDGARNLIQWLFSHGEKRRPTGFLFTWFLYHEVLACFTQPLREMHSHMDLLALLDTMEYDKSIIIGSLGCAVSILEIIHKLNRLRARILLKGQSVHDPDLIQERFELGTQLHNLTQRLDPEEEAIVTRSRQSQILATAELYRLAAVIYLQRICPQHDDEITRAGILDLGLWTLGQLEVATSPWPLFVLAVECHRDEQRMQIMRTLDKMDSQRNIGNVLVMRGMIESFWTQVDLRAAQPTAIQLKWWEMLNSNKPMPWFI